MPPHSSACDSTLPSEAVPAEAAHGQCPAPRREEPPPRPSPRAAVWLGGALAFLVGCDSMVVAPLAPELLRTWHASLGLSSLLVAAYALAYALTSPFFGALADHRGRRAVGLPGIAIFAVGTVATAAAPSLIAALTCRAVAGLGAGMIMPMVFGEIASRSTEKDRGRNIGTVMGLLLASTVIGLPLGAFTAAAAGWRTVFAALAFLAVIVLFPAGHVFSRAGTGQIDGPVTAALTRMLATAVTSPRLLLALLATFWWNAGLAVLFSAIGLFYLDQYHFGPGTIGLVILAAGIASVAGAMAGSRLASRLGPLTYFTLTALFAAIGVLATVWSPPRLAATIAGHVMWSLAIGAGQPVLTTLAATLAPRLQGTALALNGSTQYLAQFLAATLGAAILSRTHAFLSLGCLAAGFALFAAATVIALQRMPTRSCCRARHRARPPAPSRAPVTYRHKR